MRPAIQLHSVRGIDLPLPDVVRKVEQAGFEGIEFGARVRDAHIPAVRDAVQSTGIVPLGGHVDLRELETNTTSLLDMYADLDCRWVTVPHLPIPHFRTRQRVRELAARLEDLAEQADRRGLDLVCHNTRFDLAPMLDQCGLHRLVDSRFFPAAGEGVFSERIRSRLLSSGVEATGIGYLADRTAPSHLNFQLDTAEVIAAGYGIDQAFDSFGDRLQSVHICDVTGPAENYRSTRPGTGKVDIEATIDAARRNGVSWLVYEHDYPTDPVRTIHQGANRVASRVQTARTLEHSQHIASE